MSGQLDYRDGKAGLGLSTRQTDRGDGRGMKPTPITAADIFGTETSVTDGIPRAFRRVDEGHYRLALKELADA
jgi:hypothetical protein